MSNQELSYLILLPRLPTADVGVFFLLPLFPGQGRRFYARLFQTGSCWQILKALNSVNSVSKLHVNDRGGKNNETAGGHVECSGQIF